MKVPRGLRKIIVGIGGLAMLLGNGALACTSLSYLDAKGNVYHGRTLELQMELPYQIAYFPAGTAFTSDVGDGHPPLKYNSTRAMLTVVIPDVDPGGRDRPTLNDLKVLEGQNDAGLVFSLLSYPSAAGPQKQVEMTRSILNAIDLGTWILAQFATVKEAKSALANQPTVLEPLKVLKGALPPFHFVLYDKSGASLVIEFTNGQEALYDNPVGVMTNGPEFSWHLTNLGNYSYLSNVDRSGTTFNGFKVKQPDSGIATAGLPSSDTSVGRFVRAAYYSNFAEKVNDPDKALLTMSHIMNNFDRPKGISTSAGGEGDALTSGLGGDPNATSTEYTSWTKISDLDRGLVFLRTYQGLNYSKFDLKTLSKQSTPLVMPLTKIDQGSSFDQTTTLINSPAR